MGGGRDGLSEDKANLSPQLGLSWGLGLSLAIWFNFRIEFLHQGACRPFFFSTGNYRCVIELKSVSTFPQNVLVA